MKKKTIIPLLCLVLLFAAYMYLSSAQKPPAEAADPGEDPTLTEYFAARGELPAGTTETAFSLEAVPTFTDTAFAVVNNNVPYFTLGDLSAESYEHYAPLDLLGRCGTAVASVGTDLMPTEDRGSISQIKPTGWNTAKYDFVDGKNLYNRCHLIGFQLTGENANERNLITGTRYMNVQGMLPFENMVSDYVKETGSHVLYRVTPVFEGREQVARGILMEAASVEDRGESVLFCVFCYNVQPGVSIDYATGDSREELAADADDVGTFVLNTGSMKFHRPDCSGAVNMKPENRQEYTGSRQRLILSGYKPCGTCDP